MPGSDRQPSSPGAEPSGLQHFRIDQHQRLIPLFAHIEHDHALVHVDLGGREPHALGGVHGFEHVVDQLTQRIIDRRHRRSLLPQPRIGILQNYELCHGSYESNIVFLAEECC